MPSVSRPETETVQPEAARGRTFADNLHGKGIRCPSGFCQLNKILYFQDLFPIALVDSVDHM
jgi:hypothetical protein